MTRIITIAEVKKNKSGNSVWIIIRNDVYDVTSYLEEHPGGEKTLLDVAGKDGTEDFDDVGHSSDARELLTKFKIGTLPPEERDIKIQDDLVPKARSDCSICTGSASREAAQKCVHTVPSTPRIERRVQSIVVPRERPSGKWKYIIALAGAILIGFALKKYLATR